MGHFHSYVELPDAARSSCPILGFWGHHHRMPGPMGKNVSVAKPAAEEGAVRPSAESCGLGDATP